MKYRPIEERFWEKVDIKDSNDCWEWKAQVSGGYGRLKVNNVSQLAHRISYELKNGEIPDNFCILHTCDNRKCVNPSHLYAGTKKDNAIDRKVRNRGGDLRGEKNGRSRFSNYEIRLIRRLYKTGIYTQIELANYFDVRQSQISAIVTKRIWNHI